jgi:MFS family permease
MDLTWRDAISTLALCVIVVLYSTYLESPGGWLLSSTWATAAAILIIGLGGLVVGVRGDKHGRSQELFGVITRRASSVFAVIGLIVGLGALVADSAYALKLLVMSSLVAWASLLLSHV